MIINLPIKIIKKIRLLHEKGLNNHEIASIFNIDILTVYSVMIDNKYDYLIFDKN